MSARAGVAASKIARTARFIPGMLPCTCVIERLVDSGRIPEPVLRLAIRAICAQRLRDERGSIEAEAARHAAFVETLRSSEIAIETAAANAQHYEVPAAFYERVLGPHLKYSSCYWPHGVTTLGEAEAAML